MIGACSREANKAMAESTLPSCCLGVGRLVAPVWRPAIASLMRTDDGSGRTSSWLMFVFLVGLLLWTRGEWRAREERERSDVSELGRKGERALLTFGTLLQTDNGGFVCKSVPILAN